MKHFFVSIHTNLVNYKSLFICPNLTMFCFVVISTKCLKIEFLDQLKKK